MNPAKTYAERTGIIIEVTADTRSVLYSLVGAFKSFFVRFTTISCRLGGDPYGLISANTPLGGLFLFLLDRLGFEEVFAEAEESKRVADHEDIGDEVEEGREADA